MKSEPNAEAGIYPFEECCEHSFRVHSSKACQISGCDCKRRRQLPSIPRNGHVEKDGPVDLVQHLQAEGWALTHEVVRGSETTMVITRIIRPDGTVLDTTAWTP